MNEKKLVITPAKIRFAAMDLLTGREFSRSELAKKLVKRFDKDSAIEIVLDKLQQEGLQCDQRFAEAFVRSRLYRGHGMARIRLDIRQKGIGDALFESAIQKAEINWFELARDVAQRKFGGRAAADLKEKAKRMRFLQYRGFNFDQIKYALQEKDSDEYLD